MRDFYEGEWWYFGITAALLFWWVEVEHQHDFWQHVEPSPCKVQKLYKYCWYFDKSGLGSVDACTVVCELTVSGSKYSYYTLRGSDDNRDPNSSKFNKFLYVFLEFLIWQRYLRWFDFMTVHICWQSWNSTRLLLICIYKRLSWIWF